MLIGREAELRRAAEACRDAVGGRGSVLVVAGEPGIGKTALLATAAESSDEWRSVAVTGVEAESAIAFATLQALLWPLREALDEVEAGQAALLHGILELGPSVEATTFAVAAAALTLLSTAAEAAPLVLIIDDVQWADLPSQEALAFVGRRLEHERIALLAGWRDDEPSPFAEERLFAHVRLEGLGPEDAHALLGAAAPGELDAAVADRLVDACAGNPLGLIELPLALTEAQRHGVELLPASLEAGPLVQRAFAARAGGLGTEARHALLLIAAAGDAELSVLAQAGVSVSTLDEIEGARLVSRGETVRFRHPLMRAAVYGAASAAERRGAHRSLAEIVEGARRAWHLAEAADGPDEEAANALQAAAERARAAGGAAAEAQAIERAAVLRANDDERARDLLAGAHAWRRAGRIEHAEALLSRALDLAGEEATRGRVQLERGYNLIRATRYREAYELLLAEARQAEARDPELAARLYAATTLAANVYPEAQSPLGYGERAVGLAGARGDDVELEALFALITARMARPVPPDEEDDRLVARAAELLERPGLRTGEQPHWIAYALAELEHDDEARALSDVALVEARAGGDAWSLSYGLYARAVVELVGGRVDSARTWVADALPLAEQVGEVWRIEQANAVREEIEAACGNSLEDEGGLQRGRSLLALGRFEDAAPLLETAVRELAGGSPRAWYRLVPMDLAEACVGMGKASEAERVLHDAGPAVDGCRLVRPRARLARVRALLAPEAKIDAAFAESAGLLEDRPHPLEHGRIELCWGERLRRVGRSSDARPHLERALTQFEALNAPGWAARTRAELEAVGGEPRPAQPRRTDALTPQELRVARHAASGLRDREIAAKLYLSPRTVESYLHHAYQKLDVSNRTQLAGVLAAEGIWAETPVAELP